MVVRRVLLLAMLVLAVGCIPTVWWLSAPHRIEAAEETALPVRPLTAQIDPTSPVRILAEWDERRASAWATGDRRALRNLYVAGSDPALEDVRRLKGYLDRGLRVEGLTMQVLSVSVVQRDSRSMDLEVTDRLVGGVAVGGTGRFALPQGRPSTKVVRLVRSHETWLVEDVSSTRPRSARR